MQPSERLPRSSFTGILVIFKPHNVENFAGTFALKHVVPERIPAARAQNLGYVICVLDPKAVGIIRHWLLSVGHCLLGYG